MYEIIMDLPLFQGMSHEKVSELIEKTKFHFLKFSAGDKIIATAEDCEYVRFVISGKVKIIYPVAENDIIISSVVSAPDMIGIEYLFGKDRNYPYSAEAYTDCGILQISKSDYVHILQNDNVFLFNLVNILSRNCQKGIAGLLSAGGSVAHRLAYDVLMLTSNGSTNICYEFKQKDLCQRFGVQRSSLINALDQLQDADIIEYDSSHIKVHDRSKVVDLLV